MKKLALFLGALLVTPAAFAQATGEISFTGEITQEPCNVTVPNQGVKLGSFTSRFLGTDGQGEWANGTIVLSGCDLAVEGGEDLSSVTIKVLPGQASENNNFWRNMGSAGNVGVEVEINQQPITPAGGSIAVDLTGDRTEIGVRGRIVKSNAEAATAGDVESVVSFEASFL